MTKDEISDNLKAFQEGMGRGMTREEAARGTPTGKVATKAGFDVVSVEDVSEPQEHLKDEAGHFWRVTVPQIVPHLCPTTCYDVFLAF